VLGAPQDIVNGIVARKVHATAFVHPLAHIQRTVSIGAGTKVWQFASVIRNAQIGENCSIAAGAIVDGSVVGNRSIVSHCAFIDPGMVIGNNCFIGPHVSLCNDIWPRSHRRGWFDMDDLIGGLVTVTRVRDGASIGAGAVIMPGVVIGMDAMVAAHATVTGDVPDGHLWKRDGRIVPAIEVEDRKRACSP